MQITKEQLKAWNACTDGYRYFLDKFPQGGSYSEVHQALINDSRFDDARWLVEKMYDTHIYNAEFIKSEIAATDKMVANLTSEAESNTGDDARIGSSGYYAQIGSSGDDALIGISGHYARIGSSGHCAQIGSSGYYAQIGSSGDDAQIGSSGDDAQIGSSGDCALIGSSGYRARIGSSGDDARIGISGYDARIGSSGHYARIGSSGHCARIGSSGDDAQIGSSGDCAQIAATGKNSIVAASGSVHRIVLGESSCAAIPYFDGSRTRFAIAYVGENGIKANTPYEVNSEGEFVEISDN
ncbi:hypothetical protein [Serratia symbiotica]|uniref:Uncharacterized protein n=1 Tax=Serratia symbiotica TaxID=138074 RepID=A0A068Z0D4_9GAMM|nr:hypothetical protein [Serratia symbiotica]QLH62277.1 hypothetical protein SYMBAF_04035 [Serratia symbiotica]CDS55691.1 conserved hypothetical protein [Serratia symbiotica]